MGKAEIMRDSPDDVVIGTCDAHSVLWTAARRRRLLRSLRYTTGAALSRTRSPTLRDLR